MSMRFIKSRSLGRLELLDWLNDLVETDYTKISHLCDGIAFVLVFDCMYGERKVPLDRVIFDAKEKSDYVYNFKILEKVFEDCKISTRLPIEKLADGKWNGSQN